MSAVGALDEDSLTAMREAWTEGGPALWDEFGYEFWLFARWATGQLFTTSDGDLLKVAPPSPELMAVWMRNYEIRCRFNSFADFEDYAHGCARKLISSASTTEVA